MRNKLQQKNTVMFHLKFLKSFFLFAVVLLNFSSCTFKEVEFKKVESFKLLNTDSKGAVVELYILLKNPNKMAITVNNLDMNVMVNQTNIGKINLAEKVKINARSEKAHRFVIKANYSDIAVGGFSSLLSIIMAKKVNLSCSGNITAKALGVSRTMPVDFKGDVPLSYFMK
jgi:LEA14-like dessication related protein